MWWGFLNSADSILGACCFARLVFHELDVGNDGGRLFEHIESTASSSTAGIRDVLFQAHWAAENVKANEPLAHSRCRISSITFVVPSTMSLCSTSWIRSCNSCKLSPSLHSTSAVRIVGPASHLVNWATSCLARTSTNPCQPLV